MQTPNYSDPDTGETHYIPVIKTRLINGKWTDCGSDLKPLVNANGNPLVLIPKDGMPQYCKSNNKESLQKMLKKRSQAHFKKEIEPYKHELNQKLKGE